MALSVSEARQAYQRYRDIRQEIGPINGKDPEAKNAQRSLLLEQATSEHLPSFKEVISTLRESNRIARLQSVETSVITPQPKTPGEKLAEQLLGGYAHFKKRSRTPEATEKFWTQQTGQVFTATRESIGDVFKYLASHEEDSERVKNFKRELTKRLTDRAKKEWETFSPAKLANMLYLYTHSPFAKEMAEQVLTGFFKGPETTIKTTSIGEMPPYPSKPLLLDPQVSGQKVVIKGDQARAFLEYQIAQEKYNLWIRGVVGTEKERFDLRSARIKALQKLAVAALQYLSTDQAAFRTAGRIGTGKTIMLPYNGDFFTDAVYARLLTVDFLDKDELTPTKTLSQIPGKVKALDALKLYTEAATTIEALTAIAKVSGVLYEEEYKIEGYTGAQRVALLRNFELRAKGWSPEQITQAIDVVNNATDFHLAGGNRKEVDEFLRGNPLRTALYRSSNPRIQEIRRLYGKVITPDLAVKDWKQSVFEKAEGIQLSEAMGSTVDGRLINLLYPSDFTGTALEMLQAIERNEHAKEGDEYSNEEPLTVEEVANMGGINAHLGEVEINGATIYYLIRPTAVQEEANDRTTALETFGFPVIPPAELGRAFDESNGLARQIIGDGERVLDRQGYRVSLKHSSLARYGYTAIEFHDMDYSGETVVILEHAGVPYQLHLDVNYNLDFKGKTPPSADFQAFLLYTALSYLKPIVCEPSDSTVVRDAGTERRSNAEGTLLSRIGHFRKLPAGHTYSKEAVGNCATYTRRNLHDINALNRMRGLPLRTFVKPTPEVPPTEEEFNNLTPRKVSVPTPAALEKSS